MTLQICLHKGASAEDAGSSDDPVFRVKPARKRKSKTAVLVGTSGPDTINGTAQGDDIDALAGNDTVDGRGGGDFIFGQQGDLTGILDRAE